ncbi:hypothetical protein ACTJIJ_12395 [Niabella sp. 22666]|uniref:hypothetical protein n=1 Tax=Niabella sp. 22666 TaxID=3453954 RepID=UPI003F83FF3D
MMRSKLGKGLALTFSIFLVTIFLCYRAGLFPDLMNSDAALQTSPNGSSIQSNTIAKPSKPKDTLPGRRMFSSSKSMILADPKQPPPVDVWKHKLKSKALLTEQQIMSSSKSGIIVKPTAKPQYTNRDYKKNTDTSIFK